MPDTENGSLTLERAQEMISEFSAVNLDEVAPEVIKVAFREFVPRVGGGYMIQTTAKEINTWVPFWLFNRMLANQKQVQKLRRQRAALEAATDEQTEPETEPLDLLQEEEQPLDFLALTDELFREVMSNSEPAIVWQVREVLAVWKLTPGEEHMSLKRLVLGLTFEQIEGLFSRFFGAMLRRRQIRA